MPQPITERLALAILQGEIVHVEVRTNPPQLERYYARNKFGIGSAAHCLVDLLNDLLTEAGKARR